MPHVVLAGDSILDNGAYVPDGRSVTEQLRSRLPRDWRVTLLAIDGAITSSVMKQLQRLPDDTSHLVISVGGNDALESSPIVNSPTVNSVEMLSELVSAQVEFCENYRHMIQAIRATRLPALACTVYDAVPGLHPIERMALSLFNDVILRELISAKIPALDLRFVCDESRDYSSISPIEPSEIGGSKIARALQRVLTGYDFSRSETVVFT